MAGEYRAQQDINVTENIDKDKLLKELDALEKGKSK